MGGCAAAWQDVRGVPESREHVVTETGVGVGMKALAPHLTVALEELALLRDIRQRAEGAKERKKTQSSHSSFCFHQLEMSPPHTARGNKAATCHPATSCQ